MVDGQIPNAGDWALAARAYTTLLVQNQGYVTSVQRDRLATITNDGQRLAAFTAAIAAHDTQADTGSTLFNNLFDNYRYWGADVVNELGLAKRDWASSELVGYNPNPATPTGTDTLKIDLWGAAEQTPDEKPKITTTTCEKGGDQLPLPANATLDARVPNAFLLASRLGLGTVSVACAATWLDVQQREHFLHDRATTTEYGRLHVELRWQYTPVVGRSDALDLDGGVHRRGRGHLRLHGERGRPGRQRHLRRPAGEPGL